MKPCHNDPRTAIVMPLRILAIGLLVMVASVAASSAPETVMGVLTNNLCERQFRVRRGLCIMLHRGALRNGDLLHVRPH